MYIASPVFTYCLHASKHQCFCQEFELKIRLVRSTRKTLGCDPLDPETDQTWKLLITAHHQRLQTSPSQDFPPTKSVSANHPEPSRILRLLCASCLKPLGSRRSRILEKTPRLKGVWCLGWLPMLRAFKGTQSISFSKLGSRHKEHVFFFARKLFITGLAKLSVFREIKPLTKLKCMVVFDKFAQKKEKQCMACCK